MGRRAAPPRKAVGAAAPGPPRLGAARHPSPAVHTKGPRDPASCSRRRAGPGLWARLQSLPPGRVSGPRLPRASSGLWGGGGGALPAGPPAAARSPLRPPPPLRQLPPGPGCLRRSRRLPRRPHPPGRPGGSVTPRPWPTAGCSVSPPPQRRCSRRGKGRGPSGGGGHSGRSHLFFFSPTPHPPPTHTRKGFPDTLAEVPQFPETGRDHFRWGKSHLSGASRVALGPRPAEREGRGRSRVGAAALAEGLSENLRRPSLPCPQPGLPAVPRQTGRSPSASPPLAGRCGTAGSDLASGRASDIPGLEGTGKIKQPRNFSLLAGISNT